MSKETYYVSKETYMSKETYYMSKRDLLYEQKRP